MSNRCSHGTFPHFGPSSSHWSPGAQTLNGFPEGAGEAIFLIFRTLSDPWSVSFMVKTTTVSNRLRSPNFRSWLMKASLTNAFAQVGLQKIQEFHLWLLNTDAPDRPCQSLLWSCENQRKRLNSDEWIWLLPPLPFQHRTCWKIKVLFHYPMLTYARRFAFATACFEHSNLFKVKRREFCWTCMRNIAASLTYPTITKCIKHRNERYTDKTCSQLREQVNIASGLSDTQSSLFHQTIQYPKVRIFEGHHQDRHQR